MGWLNWNKDPKDDANEEEIISTLLALIIFSGLLIVIVFTSCAETKAPHVVNIVATSKECEVRVDLVVQKPDGAVVISPTLK